ncbi:MAG: ATP-binding protein [Myxococcales bacterium]|nr:ATP-binding protein [Myxococcales bacterium]
MAERNWGAIANGATFEALATTIVFFEDPKAALFGRRGRDGGQDARSGDGTLVYQAKHHVDGLAASAIRDATEEAAKISAYRRLGHPRHSQWKGVTTWRLVTNAAFNPTDDQKWNDEVVPLFAAHGLIAEYWERPHLDALLDKWPEVHRSFFENETRAFLTIPEVREALPEAEPFLRRDSLGAFVGRSDELAEVRNFLASGDRFLVAHGPGGIGKTRLLVAAGEEIAGEGDWQVLWANVASMRATGAWFGAIVPERPTLLLVDEPSDEQLLQQLAEQLGGRVGRPSKWKVAVAVRTAKDPVLRFLRGPRMKASVREVEVKRLGTAAAAEMCVALLKAGPMGSDPSRDLAQLARELAPRFSGYPIWLTLAVHLIERRGDLAKVPATAAGLADSYLDEIVQEHQGTAPGEVLTLIRWIALLGAVDHTDDAAMKLVGGAVGLADVGAVRARLSALVARRVLASRGARGRLVELKPDVLRDHVLVRWLSERIELGQGEVVASQDAIALARTVSDAVAAGKVSPLARTILSSLGRTEAILRLDGYNLDLVSNVFVALQSAMDNLTASQRIGLAETLLAIAVFRPSETAMLARQLRTSSVQPETIDGIFGSRVISQDDVLLELAWPVCHAALGARTLDEQRAVLNELCQLAEAEAELGQRGMRNDGRRARDLIRRTLEGGSQFAGDFNEAAAECADSILSRLAAQEPTPGVSSLLEAVVEHVVSVERHQTVFDEHAVHFGRYVIGPDHPAWATRDQILRRTRQILEAGAAPTASRIALWHVMAVAHRDVNRCRDVGSSELQARWAAELLDDLSWADSMLRQREVGVRELTAVREIWDWHRRFETDPERKAAAERLEAQYRSNGLAAEFEPLVDRDDLEGGDRLAKAKAAELAASDASAIAAFFDRAAEFLGSDGVLRLNSLAWHIGCNALDHAAVRSFVLGALAGDQLSHRSEFGIVSAAAWVVTAREALAAPEVSAVVGQLVAACSGDAVCIDLLARIYRAPLSRADRAKLGEQEHRVLRQERERFVRNGRAPEFLRCVAATMDFDLPGLKSIVEQTLDETPVAQTERAVGAFLEGVYWGVREATPASPLAGITEWVLEQVARLPDTGELGGNAEWHLGEVLKACGRPAVSWVPRILHARREREGRADPEKWRAVSHQGRITSYVAKVAAESHRDPAVRNAVSSLIDFVDDNGTLGYYLPEVLSDVDPAGVLVPDEVARRVDEDADAETVHRLARVAGAYALGSRAWRTIAKAALVRAGRSGDQERRHIYSAISPRGVRTWSSAPGQVAEVFVDDLAEARRAEAAEQDSEFRPYWSWRVAVAQAALAGEEELAKEERGE